MAKNEIFISTFRFVVILNYVTILVYDKVVEDDYYQHCPERQRFGGSWKNLTYWNILLQILYFSLAIIDKSYSKNYQTATSLKAVTDFVFTSLAFPVGVFVTSMFWVILSIDRELAYPAAIDQFYPSIFNHMMHTVPMPSQIIELFLVPHAYPGRKLGLFVSMSFAALYYLFVLYLGYHFGFWSYGVLEIMSHWQRAIYGLFCILLTACFYLIGELANNMVWKKPIFNIEKSKVDHKTNQMKKIINTKNFRKKRKLNWKSNFDRIFLCIIQNL